MKNLSILILSIFSLMLGSAEQSFAKTANSKNIELHAESRDQPTRRSVLPVQARFDSTAVFVSFYNTPATVSVTIMDANGEVIQKEMYLSPERARFDIANGSGSYVIEISYPDITYYGSFTL